mmetsp:Transcript_92600/g.288693  ORF Transcript_92600/g.288693 Transcript_92600/m.288693 type:complete len:206 (-) Transcript_92600:1972-2589(-)
MLGNFSLMRCFRNRMICSMKTKMAILWAPGKSFIGLMVKTAKPTLISTAKNSTVSSSCCHSPMPSAPRGTARRRKQQFLWAMHRASNIVVSRAKRAMMGSTTLKQVRKRKVSTFSVQSSQIMIWSYSWDFAWICKCMNIRSASGFARFCSVTSCERARKTKNISEARCTMRRVMKYVMRYLCSSSRQPAEVSGQPWKENCLMKPM